MGPSEDFEWQLGLTCLKKMTGCKEPSQEQGDNEKSTPGINKGGSESAGHIIGNEKWLYREYNFKVD